MPPRSVFCIATSRGRADCTVHDLMEAGFANSEISILFLDRSERQDLPPAKQGTDATDIRPSTVRPIRGVLGWIDGVGPLTIPGVGRLIAGGPLMASMSGPVGGAPVACIADGLIAFGLPALEARRQDGGIREGHIHISVRTDNPDKSDRAREIFAATGAEGIFTMVDVTASKASVPATAA
jgi:hypothetical protein